MGSWGPGVYQNDHALDLFSIEVARIGAELEKALAVEDPDWTDIEGPLLYAHLLSVLAEQSPLMRLKAATVVGWKARYLAIYDSSLEEEGLATADDPRRAVIVSTFDTLLSRLPAHDGDEAAVAKGRRSKTAAAAKPKASTPAKTKKKPTPART